MNEVKTCTSCKLLLDLSCFSRTTYNPNTDKWYRNSQCNLCRTKGNRIRLGLEERAKPVITDTEKQCLKCLNLLPFDNFSPSSRGRLGLSSYCKECAPRAPKESAREYTRSYRQRHKERTKTAHRLTQYRRRAKQVAASDGSITDEYLAFLYSQENCCWCGEFVEPESRTLEHIQELSNGGSHSVENTNMACFGCNSSRLNKTNENPCESLFTRYKEYENNES